MVGFTVKKTGSLDTKQPSTATIGRGWRYQVKYEPRCEKTGLRVSDQVRQRPGCAA